MRLFLDTNIIIEYIERRSQYGSVRTILDAIHKGAQQNRCGTLLTINISDYKDADRSRMEILTPTAFVEKYMEAEK